MSFICGHCGKEKENDTGLCSSCGRFPTRQAESCPNCGSHEFERFCYVSLEFDIAKANKIAEGGHARTVPVEFLHSMGLPLDPIKCNNCDVEIEACTCGKKSYSMPIGTGINEKHLNHLTDPEKPGIIATLLWKKFDSGLGSSYMTILIDGNHRAVRAYREGRAFTAVVLTPEQSWSVMSGLTKLFLNPNGKAGRKRLKELGWDK